jgi:hypothetical protein
MDSMRRRGHRSGAFFVSGAIVAAVAMAGIASADPPTPDFYRPYGTVQDAGANIAPEQQPVVAFVHDNNCGTGTTSLAAAGEGVPESDAGETVYVLDVLADGPGAFERTDCGRVGDTVRLYLPLEHAFLSPAATFREAFERVDATVAAPLGFQVRTPLTAADGSP